MSEEWNIANLDKEYETNGKIKAFAVMTRQKNGTLEMMTATLGFNKGTHDSVIYQSFLSVARTRSRIIHLTTL